MSGKDSHAKKKKKQVWGAIIALTVHFMQRLTVSLVLWNRFDGCWFDFFFHIAMDTWIEQNAIIQQANLCQCNFLWMTFEMKKEKHVNISGATKWFFPELFDCMYSLFRVVFTVVVCVQPNKLCIYINVYRVWDFCLKAALLIAWWTPLRNIYRQIGSNRAESNFFFLSYNLLWSPFFFTSKLVSECVCVLICVS